jgi:hypothetical protein
MHSRYRQNTRDGTAHGGGSFAGCGMGHLQLKNAGDDLQTVPHPVIHLLQQQLLLLNLGLQRVLGFLELAPLMQGAQV